MVISVSSCFRPRYGSDSSFKEMPLRAFIAATMVPYRCLAKQRAACEADAMRVPDVQHVSSGMSAYRRYLSPTCCAFYGGHRKKVRRR